jgi:DNA-binding transcriptional LysR family regulator
MPSAQRMPEVQLKLHNVTGKDGLALIRSDEVDLAVGSMLDVPNDLDYAPVQSFDPMLIAPLGHPLASSDTLTLEDLSPYGLILPPKRLTTYRLVDLVFQQRRVPLHRGAGSGRLGGDQAVRGDGAGHLNRHRHLHRGDRP